MASRGIPRLWPCAGARDPAAGRGCIKPCGKELLPLQGSRPNEPEGFHPHGHTHLKYVFVDVRPLRRFAPPPLQGGGVLPPDRPIAPDFRRS